MLYNYVRSSGEFFQQTLRRSIHLFLASTSKKGNEKEKKKKEKKTKKERKKRENRLFTEISVDQRARVIYIYNGRSPSLSIDSLSFGPFQDTSRRDSDVCLVSGVKEAIPAP